MLASQTKAVAISTGCPARPIGAEVRLCSLQSQVLVALTGRAERLERLLAHGSGDEWGPDGTGADGVDSDTLLLDDLIGQCSRESNDSTLGRGVVKELSVSGVPAWKFRARSPSGGRRRG